MAVAVAPLSGMSTIGTTEMRRPLDVPGALWKVMDSSVLEYRGDALASNLIGTPFMARTGSADRVIDPRSTRHMAKLLSDAGVRWAEKRSGQEVRWEGVTAAAHATVVELSGKEHWWWDTNEANDGGVMDDEQMRNFWNRSLLSEPSVAEAADAAEIRFVCANLASCGSRAGVRLLQQAVPGVLSSGFSLRRGSIR